MSNTFTCIIVDDEQDAIDLLTARLNMLYENIEIAGKYTTWGEALNGLRTVKPDIVFMDISIPGKSGMDLLRLVPSTEAEIIFVTAYEEYALRAFEFTTSGYILKPVDDEELVHSVNKAMQRIRDKKVVITPAPVKIGVPDSKGITYVNIADIQYLEAVNGYTKVVLNDGVLLSSFNLGKFKTVIQSNLFFQVHRSYLVNINTIRRYKSTGEIVMPDQTEIPVAKSVRQEFLKLFSMVSKTPGH